MVSRANTRRRSSLHAAQGACSSGNNSSGGNTSGTGGTSNNWFYPTRATSEINSSMEVRVTAIDGATITGALPAYEAGKSYEASNQF